MPPTSESAKPYTLSPAAMAAVERGRAVLGEREDIAAAIPRVKGEAAEAAAAYERAKARAEKLLGSQALEAANRLLDGAGVVASLKTAPVSKTLKKGFDASATATEKDIEAANSEMRTAAETRERCEAVLRALERKEADANMELLEAAQALREALAACRVETVRRYRIEFGRAVAELARVMRLGYALSFATAASSGAQPLGDLLRDVSVPDPLGLPGRVLGDGRYSWMDDPRGRAAPAEELGASWRKDAALAEIFERLSPLTPLLTRLERELRKMPGWMNALESLPLQRKAAEKAAKSAA